MGIKNMVRELWKLKNVEVIPVVFEALGTVLGRLNNWIEKIDLQLSVEMLQNNLVCLEQQ